MYNNITAYYKDRSTFEDEDISETSMAERVAIRSARNEMYRDDNFYEPYIYGCRDNSMYYAELQKNIQKVMARRRKFREREGFWL